MSSLKNKCLKTTTLDQTSPGITGQHGYVTSTLASGHSVTWVSNPYFDNYQNIKEMPTTDSVVASLEEVLKSTPLTPEELTALHAKLDDVIRQARINQTAKIALTL
jgi:hypothetical protein